MGIVEDIEAACATDAERWDEAKRQLRLLSGEDAGIIHALIMAYGIPRGQAAVIDCLAENAGRIVPAGAIAARLEALRFADGAATGSVGSYVKRIRKATDISIRTIYGVGYVIDKDEAERLGRLVAGM